MKVTSETTSFSCPLCNCPKLRVFKRGEVPIDYHCGRCSARLTPSWTHGDDDSYILEQATHDGKKYTLGKTVVTPS